MKTIRTILATFGITTMLYGVIALIAMRLNPAFTGRTIYQLFRDTGFVALVIGIGCILSFVIMTIAVVSFRDENTHKKHDFAEADEFGDFLEEETVPAERAYEADESWSPEVKRKQRRALYQAQEPTPDLFADEPEERAIRLRSDYRPKQDAAYRPAALPAYQKQAQEPAKSAPAQPKAAPTGVVTKQCIYCGETIEADSAFCIFCGKRV